MIFDVCHPDRPLGDLARFSEHGTYVGDDGMVRSEPASGLDRIGGVAYDEVNKALRGEATPNPRRALGIMVELALSAARTAEDPVAARMLIRHLEASIALQIG